MLDTSGRIFVSRAAEGINDLRVLEGIPDAVIVHDASGQLIYANEAAAQVLDLRPTDLQGETDVLADRF